MGNRRADDERIIKMLEDMNEIKGIQTKICKCQERIEMALFGDNELNHKGLICQTQDNKDEIKNLNNFKQNIKVAATAISVVFSILFTVITNFVMQFFK